MADRLDHIASRVDTMMALVSEQAAETSVMHMKLDDHIEISKQAEDRFSREMSEIKKRIHGNGDGLEDDVAELKIKEALRSKREGRAFGALVAFLVASVTWFLSRFGIK